MDDADIGYMSALDLMERYRQRDLSPVEATAAILGRIRRLNERVNAFVLVDHDGAMAQARRSEQRWIEGRAGPLEGVPVAIKDLNPVEGLVMTHGSVVFKDYVPDFEGVFTRRLRAAGAVILGKTNTPEFGTSYKTDNRLFGPSINPWSAEHNTGGSSGGAAAALAMGFGPIAHGNDAGGSIRVPAAFCHVFGLKPTFGRIPNDFALGQQVFSHEGNLSRAVADTALFLNVCAGPDPVDPYGIDSPPPDYLAAMEEPPRSLRIAWTSSFGGPATHPEIATAVEEAATSVATSWGTVEQVKPDYGYVREAFRTVFSVDSLALLPQEVRGRLDELAGLNRELILRSEKIAAVEYATALGVVAQLRRDVRRLFADYDLLLCPVSSAPPFRNDDAEWDIEHEIPLQAWSRILFTLVFDVAGNPAASVPWAFTKAGLPIAIQIVGRFGEEERVLQAARAVELERPWSSLRPPAATRVAS